MIVVRRLSEQTATESHGVDYRLERLGRYLLGHEADHCPRQSEIVDDVVTVDEDLPARRVDDAADDTDERRLARTIGAE